MCPKSAPICCLVYKCAFISFTCVRWVLLSRLGKQTWCDASPSQREVENKAETGGLDLKTSFPCQSVKEEECQSVLRIQLFCRCCFKAFFSEYVLGAACFCHWFFCGRSLPPVSAVSQIYPHWGTSLQSSKMTAGVIAKTCHIYFML